MKRIIAIFLILLFSVSIYACGEKDTAESTEESKLSETKDEVTDTDDQEEQIKEEGEVQIIITPPEGWTKVEGSVLPVQYMKGTASFMVKAEPFNQETLDDVVTEAISIYEKSFDGFAIQGESETFTVDEKDARKLTFTSTISGMKMKYVYVYLFAADSTYVITFGDLESNIDLISSDIDTILNDIKFNTQ